MKAPVISGFSASASLVPPQVEGASASTSQIYRDMTVTGVSATLPVSLPSSSNRSGMVENGDVFQLTVVRPHGELKFPEDATRPIAGALEHGYKTEIKGLETGTHNQVFWKIAELSNIPSDVDLNSIVINPFFATATFKRHGQECQISLLDGEEHRDNLWEAICEYRKILTREGQKTPEGVSRYSIGGPASAPMPLQKTGLLSKIPHLINPLEFTKEHGPKLKENATKSGKTLIDATEKMQECHAFHTALLKHLKDGATDSKLQDKVELQHLIRQLENVDLFAIYWALHFTDQRDASVVFKSTFQTRVNWGFKKITPPEVIKYAHDIEALFIGRNPAHARQKRAAFTHHYVGSQPQEGPTKMFMHLWESGIKEDQFFEKCADLKSGFIRLSQHLLNDIKNPPAVPTEENLKERVASEGKSQHASSSSSSGSALSVSTEEEEHGGDHHHQEGDSGSVISGLPDGDGHYH